MDQVVIFIAVWNSIGDSAIMLGDDMEIIISIEPLFCINKQTRV